MMQFQKVDPNSVTLPYVPLDDFASSRFSALWRVWVDSLAGNLRKQAYYDCEQPLDATGVNVPPHLRRSLSGHVDWATKAVDYLANRSVFDGFVFKDDDEDAERIDGILKANSFDTAYPAAVRAELICSPAALTVSAGDESKGEPSVLLRAYSATESAMLWDERAERIQAAFTVVSADDQGHPDRFNLYLGDRVIEMWRTASNSWKTCETPHSHGRPLIEPLVHRFDRSSPFGHSRISKPVRDVVDTERRNQIRIEVAAELFSMPQRYVMGADEGLFDDSSKWDAYWGSIFAVTTNEEGEKPTYGQLAQMSMEPLLSVSRANARRFASITGVPAASLGVASENNPTSAEAMHMAENDIIIEAEALNRANGHALERVARLALAIDRGVPLPMLREVAPNAGTVTARFKSPTRPSAAQSADFAVKVSSVAPWFTDTPLFTECLGFDQGERMRIQAARDVNSARRLLEDIE